MRLLRFTLPLAAAGCLIHGDGPNPVRLAAQLPTPVSDSCLREAAVFIAAPLPMTDSSQNRRPPRRESQHLFVVGDLFEGGFFVAQTYHSDGGATLEVGTYLGLGPPAPAQAVDSAAAELRAIADSLAAVCVLSRPATGIQWRVRGP